MNFHIYNIRKVNSWWNFTKVSCTVWYNYLFSNSEVTKYICSHIFFLGSNNRHDMYPRPYVQIIFKYGEFICIWNKTYCDCKSRLANVCNYRFYKTFQGMTLKQYILIHFTIGSTTRICFTLVLQSTNYLQH